jgi:hypothetical protein
VTDRTVPGVDYCNVAAQALGLDPAGHADSFDGALLLETPLPWKREIYQRAGALPQRILELLTMWRQRYEAGLPYNHRLLMIAPDSEYSRPGFRRVIFFTRPPGAFAAFTRIEYLAPEETVGELVWALYEAPHQLSTFERYRTSEEAPTDRPVRDILVCTHGAIDAACARFGYPLYRHLRDGFAGGSLRVWRASHFGGHVFAPTLIDMPTGHYWAYVGEAQVAPIVRRDGDVVALYGHYRGWAGLEDGFAQAAERAMWQREGWRWFDYARNGAATVKPGMMPEEAQVDIGFTDGDGAVGFYTAHVEVSHTVNTRHSTTSDDFHAYSQYRVRWLRRTLCCS